MPNINSIQEGPTIIELSFKSVLAVLGSIYTMCKKAITEGKLDSFTGFLPKIQSAFTHPWNKTRGYKSQGLQISCSKYITGGYIGRN